VALIIARVAERFNLRVIVPINMVMTMSGSIATQQHKLGQFKQTAAAPRVAVRVSRRQQPVTRAILTTIPRVPEQPGNSSNSGGSPGSLRVMSLISSLVDIEVSLFYIFTTSQRISGAACAIVGPAWP
jgi:hypothetical protein